MLDEDIWNMEYGKGKFPTAGIPIGAVVTASGTGAEMNAGAVITYEEKKWKGPVFGTAASFAVLDPAYTMSVPPMQVLSGAFDTLSHALENFIKECGLPTKMNQLKSTVEITPEVLRQVADTCNIIKTGPRELDREEIYQILMECM